MSASQPCILVTGGAGFIGSHTCVELVQAGYQVVVMDNLCNASHRSISAVERITQKPLTFMEADIRDESALARVFAEHEIAAVIHFAGLKAVGESTEQPTRYYDNNVNGTLKLIEAMVEADCKTMVFSSSATVYRNPPELPLTEDAPTGPINPYGRSKLMVEEILRDQFAADPEWRIALLRYFNPVGAHASGEIGEDPRGIPNNLMPFISQVAVGRRAHLQVFGDDYDTHDGTGVRDYIHVVDLARGHIKALERLSQGPALETYNLGTGKGYSVLDAVKAFENASGVPIPYEVVDRRAGDADASFADVERAQTDLGWRAEYDLEQMCIDAWRWQSQHPNGFAGDEESR